MPPAHAALAFPDLAVPSWVASCSDAVLRRDVGDSSYTRGVQYARSGKVLGLIAGSDGALTAQVRGSGRRRYDTVVRPTPARGGRPPGWSGACSCPVQVDCKHAVAVVLTARRLTSPAAAPPEWERRLSALTRVDADERGAPLGLQVEVVGPLQSGSSRRRLRLRPVRFGASGRWVRTGASWRELQYSYAPTRAAHREALLELQRAWQVRRPPWYPTTDTALHLDEVGPSALRLLAAAREAGVALLDGAGQPTVRLTSEPAGVRVDVQRVGDGDGVVLRPSVVLPETDGGAATLLGQPAFGVFTALDGELLLAALDPPLDPAVEVLLSQPPLRVPERDVPRLVRRYLPLLGRRAEVVSSDDSVPLAAVEPPRLALDVHHEPGHVADLAWSFEYACGDDDVVLVAVDAAPAEGDDVARDPGAERALLHALADLPDVPGVWTGTPRRPAATARLAGMATVRLTTELLPALQERDVAVTVSGKALDYRFTDAPPLVEVSVRDDARGDPDWFDLGVSVSVAGETVPLPMLLTALAQGQSHLVLLSGTVLPLDIPELAALQQLLEEARGLLDVERASVRVTPLQAGLFDDLVALGVVREQSERWQRTVRGLLDLADAAPPAEPPLKLQAELRSYQHDGYRWLAQLWDLRLGGVLADDMGLGKTVQVLALAARAYEAGELDAPLLVVAPTSVVGAWCEQAAQFVPDLPVVAVTETSRRCGVPVAERMAGAAIVVTSYALLRLDEDEWLGQQWSALVLDEAQHVKNPAAKAYGVARRLPAPVKLAVTGTPLENSLQDLWAMFSLVAPGLFPDLQHFTEHYRRPIETGADPERLATLRRRIRPLLLRRTKEQVAADLPPKIEQVVEVELTPAHRRIYDRYLQRERQRVLGLLDDVQRHRFAIFRSLTLLRQLSLDPVLVDDALPSVSAAKVDVLAEMLQEVAREGHRALVFSSFTGFLSRVRDRLDADGLGYCYLDGRTRDRPRRIEQFRSGDDPVFLISLKAGGTGLTLTEADYVFVLDPWWNPAVEAQAVDRAHRIGQTRTVMVYRLVATGTIEEKVLALQQRKRNLFDAVVAGDGGVSGALTADDVRALLG